MELLEGETLKHRIGSKPMTAGEVSELGAQVARAHPPDELREFLGNMGRG